MKARSEDLDKATELVEKRNIISFYIFSSYSLIIIYVHFTGEDVERGPVRGGGAGGERNHISYIISKFILYYIYYI